jgi:hypothetical protein
MKAMFETIITKFKKEVGKSKSITAREMKLIEICYQEMVVKNCNAPAVILSVCDRCNGKPENECKTLCGDCYQDMHGM